MIGSTMGEPNYCNMHTGQASHLPHNQVDQGHKNICNTFCTQSGQGEAEMRVGMCRACEKKAQHLLLSRQPHLDGTTAAACEAMSHNVPLPVVFTLAKLAIEQ